MIDLALDYDVIDKVEKEVVPLVNKIMSQDIVKIILYGSCARGDFHEDSDIDIALLTKCNRYSVKKYGDELAKISTELAMKYFAIINFVCLPYEEYMDKKNWYPYFANIEAEGVVWYG